MSIDTFTSTSTPNAAVAEHQPAIRLDGVAKSFGSITAVDGIDDRERPTPLRGDGAQPPVLGHPEDGRCQPHRSCSAGRGERLALRERVWFGRSARQSAEGSQDSFDDSRSRTADAPTSFIASAARSSA
jgi:hypothetical protein